METKAIDGVCLCCASLGIFKDMYATYSWMGQDEIYADMLQYCFDITVTTENQNGGICEVCITQLRNAANFKKQIQRTEIQIKKLHEEKEFNPQSVKIELSEMIEDVINDNEMSDSDTEFTVRIKEENPEPKAKKRSKASSSKKEADEGETSTKRTDGAPPKRRRKRKKTTQSATPERLEHRVNLTAILQHSNASPFRDKTMRGFSCLYCAKHFLNIQDLRAHTAQKEEKDKINKMINYKLSYNPIKIDITDLCCTICSMNMRDLNDFKDHLVSVHDKLIYRNIKDIILPFRLENGQNYTCVICSVVHKTFKNLYHHMSSHYRNYCCKKCGAGYITVAALRKHGKTHYQGNFPCDFCDKIYTSLTKKRNHEKGVHTGGWMRNKCPHCPEIFVSYYDRSEHLVKMHNEAPIIYPCNACNRTYKKKYQLDVHIRHHHLQQKNYSCDKCNAKFFSKRGLVDHLLRHTGAELCSCDICGRSFSRARTLREHMRTHDDQMKYQCEVCKKTFMQKCSLKSHLRLHQDDLDIFKEFDDVKHLIDDRELTLKQIAAESKKKADSQKVLEQLS